MTAKELLDRLLSTNDPRVGPLRLALAGSAPLFLDTSTGEGAPLLRIYSVRAGLAKDKGVPTQGYEDLLKNLPNAADRMVTVLHVNTEAKAFLVFTDAGTGLVLGVLSGDRKA